MAYLLDTNIVVDFLRGQKQVVEFITTTSETLGLSTISLAELYHGAQKSAKPKANLTKINQFIQVPQVNLLPVDKPIAYQYGKLMSQLETKGIKLAPVDILIAATAKQHRLTILTRDQRHFARLQKFGLTVELI